MKAGEALLLVFVLAVIFVACTVDLVTCPVCHNHPVAKYFCDYCGYDGHVTILQYVLYCFQSLMVSAMVWGAHRNEEELRALQKVRRVRRGVQSQK